LIGFAVVMVYGGVFCFFREESNELDYNFNILCVFLHVFCIFILNRNNLRESDVAETTEIKDIYSKVLFQTCTPRNLIGKYLPIFNTIIHGVESIQ